MQKYPKHTRPNLRARCYQHNLMALKNVPIRMYSFYTHQKPSHRCKWCNQPRESTFDQWPNLCGRCGTLLGTWQNQQVVFVQEESREPYDWD